MHWFQYLRAYGSIYPIQFTTCSFPKVAKRFSLFSVYFGDENLPDMTRTESSNGAQKKETKRKTKLTK